jgi:hypothetical protein
MKTDRVTNQMETCGEMVFAILNYCSGSNFFRVRPEIVEQLLQSFEKNPPNLDGLMIPEQLKRKTTLSSEWDFSKPIRPSIDDYL